MAMQKPTPSWYNSADTRQSNGFTSGQLNSFRQKAVPGQALNYRGQQVIDARGNWSGNARAAHNYFSSNPYQQGLGEGAAPISAPGPISGGPNPPSFQTLLSNYMTNRPKPVTRTPPEWALNQPAPWTNASSNQAQPPSPDQMNTLPRPMSGFSNVPNFSNDQISTLMTLLQQMLGR